MSIVFKRLCRDCEHIQRNESKDLDEPAPERPVIAPREPIAKWARTRSR